MRRLAMAVLAAGLGGCADTNVQRDAEGYELVLPTDVIVSRRDLWERASDESAALCPQGFKVASATDMPSDVDWQIRCLTPAGQAH